MAVVTNHSTFAIDAGDTLGHLQTGAAIAGIGLLAYYSFVNRDELISHGHTLYARVKKGKIHSDDDKLVGDLELDSMDENDGWSRPPKRSRNPLDALSSASRRLTKKNVLILLTVLTIGLFFLSSTTWPCAPPTDISYIQSAYLNLYQIADFLEEHKVRYFLVESALLFAVREGFMQPWDYNDIDLGLHPDDAEKLWSLRDEFHKAGFYLHRARDHGFAVFPYKYYYKFPSTDLSAWWYSYVVFLGRKPIHIDLHVMDGIDNTGYLERDQVDNLSVVRFGAREFPAPKDPQHHLKSHFGANFMTPMKPAFMVQCVAYKNALWAWSGVLLLAAILFYP